MSINESQMERLVTALVKTFAFDVFWNNSPIQRVCRDIGKELGGSLAASIADVEENDAAWLARSRERTVDEDS